MDDTIIPFGKYRGQAIEALAGDKKYIKWLMDQTWFQEEYSKLYHILMNNFRETDTSPEFTTIQKKFLNPGYRVKLAYIVNPDLFYQNSERINNAMHSILKITEGRKSSHFLNALAHPIIDEEFGLYTKDLLKLSKPSFEGVDAYYSIWYGMKFYYDNENYFGGWSQFRQEMCTSYWVDIKSLIVDDFPIVLRQLKASLPIEKNEFQRDKFYILLVGEYNGTTATIPEFTSYFTQHGYRVVFENELDKTTLPEFDRELRLDPDIAEMIKQTGMIE